MDKWTENIKILARYVKDPGLIFLGSIVLIGLAIICYATQGTPNNSSLPVLIVIVLGIIGLTALLIYYRQQNNKKIVRLNEQIVSLEDLLKSRPIVVTPKDYFETLREWHNSGPGFVLLYNIELQSFKDRTILKQTTIKLRNAFRKLHE